MILLYNWDEKAYKYSIEESPQSVDKANELDQYVFIVRARIGQYIHSKRALYTHRYPRQEGIGQYRLYRYQIRMVTRCLEDGSEGR